MRCNEATCAERGPGARCRPLWHPVDTRSRALASAPHVSARPGPPRDLSVSQRASTGSLGAVLCCASRRARSGTMASLSLCAARRSAFSGAPAPRLRAPVAPARPTLVCGEMGPGKKWESYKLVGKRKLPERLPMHVKSGDMVVVITGNDKGKTGKVEAVNRKTHQVLIKGVNVKRSQQRGQDGDMEPFEFEAPVAASNVMHWSEKEQVRSRVGKKIVDGKKVRFLKKTGEVLAN